MNKGAVGRRIAKVFPNGAQCQLSFQATRVNRGYGRHSIKRHMIASALIQQPSKFFSVSYPAASSIGSSVCGITHRQAAKGNKLASH